MWLLSLSENEQLDRRHVKLVNRPGEHTTKVVLKPKSVPGRASSVVCCSAQEKLTIKHKVVPAEHDKIGNQRLFASQVSYFFFFGKGFERNEDWAGSANVKVFSLFFSLFSSSSCGRDGNTPFFAARLCLISHHWNKLLYMKKQLRLEHTCPGFHCVGRLGKESVLKFT